MGECQGFYYWHIGNAYLILLSTVHVEKPWCILRKANQGEKIGTRVSIMIYTNDFYSTPKKNIIYFCNTHEMRRNIHRTEKKMYGCVVYSSKRLTS